jgi:ribosomal protein S18 acetylase RimI-like enzyme
MKRGRFFLQNSKREPSPLLFQGRTQMGSDIQIREYRTEDYEAVAALWNEAGLPYKPQGRDRRDRVESQVKQPNVIFLVAEKGGELVGTVLGTHDGRKGWVNRLAVTTAFRNQGIARKLVEEVESRFFCQGIEIIACLIEDWNKVSMEAFEKLGYTRHSEIIYFTKKKYPEV